MTSTEGIGRTPVNAAFRRRNSVQLRQNFAEKLLIRQSRPQVVEALRELAPVKHIRGDAPAGDLRESGEPPEHIVPCLAGRIDFHGYALRGGFDDQVNLNAKCVAIAADAPFSLKTAHAASVFQSLRTF